MTMFKIVERAGWLALGFAAAAGPAQADAEAVRSAEGTE